MSSIAATQTPQEWWPIGRTGAVLKAILAVACLLLTWRVLRLDAANFTLADVLFALAAFLLLALGRFSVAPFGQVSVIFFLGIGLMLGGLLVGTIANGDPMRWGIASSQYLFAYLVMPMIFASYQSAWLRRCMVLFVVGVAISQVIGGLAMFDGGLARAVTSLSPEILTPNGRAGALTGEPNSNGAMCVIAVIFLLNAVHNRTLGWKPAVLLGAALVWGILNTASVTAIAAVTLCTLFMLTASGVGAVARFGVPIVLAGAVYIAADGPLPHVFEERVVTAIASGDPNAAGTFVGRTRLIGEAWKLAGEHLIVGMGVDRYRLVSEYGAPVHNLHVLILNEGGLIAYFGLLIMILVLIALALLVYGRNRHDGAMCLSLVGVYLVYTNAIPHMYDRIWIAPIMLGICACLPRRRVPAATPAQQVADTQADDWQAVPAGAQPVR